jgi:predicted kinase
MESSAKLNEVRPKCVLVTGRPGSGKSTLAEKLSKELYLPRISRDEIKEGYVNTFGKRHDQLPDTTNGIVSRMFFDTIRSLLAGDVSLVIEAAFQHTMWDRVVPDIIRSAELYIVVCTLDAEQSARRHLERGLADPRREFYHGDRRIETFRKTGRVEAGASYTPPTYDVPTLNVSTVDGYEPDLQAIVNFVRG